jgi:hypothetical protein
MTTHRVASPGATLEDAPPPPGGTDLCLEDQATVTVYSGRSEEMLASAAAGAGRHIAIDWNLRMRRHIVCGFYRELPS